jgi:hypothetical protein
MLKFCQFAERAYLISGMVGRRNINRNSIPKQLFEKQRPLFTKNPHDSEILNIRQKLSSHMSRISQLKEQIKKADYDIYNTKQKEI